MTRLVWGVPSSPGIRYGVDHGVLYPRTTPPVVWNGLVSVDESPTDYGQSVVYYDGQRFIQTMNPESFAASVEAITYPDEVNTKDDFDLSYRTKLDDGYELHLVYNARLAQDDSVYPSESNDANPSTFKWSLTTVPEQLTHWNACAHLVINSNEIAADLLQQVEDLLYGEVGELLPRMPHPTELFDLFEVAAVFKVVDNGDGSWTATGPDDMIQWIDATSFEITSPSANWLDSESYRLSSW